LMASWANPIVARLAAGDSFAGESVCGLVLVCSWPMPAEVQVQADQLANQLRAALPNGAYVYPPTTLHCTVMTLRAFTKGPMDAAARDAAVALWRPVLDKARASSHWPAAMPVRLLMKAPTLEGAAGIFRYDDVDGTIGKWRTALREAILEAGGLAAEGGGDRSHCKPLEGAPEGEVPPHLPDIVHSTALRWAAEPDDREAAAAAFTRVAQSWSPVEVSAPHATAVFETVPFMHMPCADMAAAEQCIWWRSEEA